MIKHNSINNTYSIVRVKWHPVLIGVEWPEVGILAYTSRKKDIVRLNGDFKWEIYVSGEQIKKIFALRERSVGYGGQAIKREVAYLEQMLISELEQSIWESQYNNGSHITLEEKNIIRTKARRQATEILLPIL